MKNENHSIKLYHILKRCDDSINYNLLRSFITEDYNASFKKLLNEVMIKSSHLDIRYKTSIKDYIEYDEAFEYLEALKELTEVCKHIIEGVYNLQQFNLPKSLYEGNTLFLDTIENIHTIIKQLKQLKAIKRGKVYTNLTVDNPFDLFMKDLECGSSLDESKVYISWKAKQTISTLDYITKHYTFYYISSLLMKPSDLYLTKRKEQVKIKKEKKETIRNLICFNIIPVFISLIIIVYLASKLVVAPYNPDDITFWSFVWRWLFIVLGGFFSGVCLSYLINLSPIKNKSSKRLGTFTYIIAGSAQIVGSYVLLYDENDMVYQPWIYFAVTSVIALSFYPLARITVYDSSKETFTGNAIIVMSTLGALITMGGLYQTSLSYSIFVLGFPITVFVTILIIALIKAWMNGTL